MNDTDVPHDSEPRDVELHPVDTTPNRKRRAAVLKAESDTDLADFDELQPPVRLADEVDLNEGVFSVVYLQAPRETLASFGRFNKPLHGPPSIVSAVKT